MVISGVRCYMVPLQSQKNIGLWPVRVTQSPPVRYTTAELCDMGGKEAAVLTLQWVSGCHCHFPKLWGWNKLSVVEPRPQLPGESGSQRKQGFCKCLFLLGSFPIPVISLSPKVCPSSQHLPFYLRGSADVHLSSRGCPHSLPQALCVLNSSPGPNSQARTEQASGYTCVVCYLRTDSIPPNIPDICGVCPCVLRDALSGCVACV